MRIFNNYCILLTAEKCVVNIITEKVDHNHKTKRTVLTFKADNPSATYTCKLDKQSHKSCKLF